MAFKGHTTNKVQVANDLEAATSPWMNKKDMKI